MKEIEVNYSVQGIMTMLPLYSTVKVNDPNDKDEVKKAVFEQEKGSPSTMRMLTKIDQLTVYL